MRPCEVMWQTPVILRNTLHGRGAGNSTTCMATWCLERDRSHCNPVAFWVAGPFLQALLGDGTPHDWDSSTCCNAVQGRLITDYWPIHPRCFERTCSRAFLCFQCIMRSYDILLHCHTCCVTKPFSRLLDDDARQIVPIQFVLWGRAADGSVSKLAGAGRWGNTTARPTAPMTDGLVTSRDITEPRTRPISRSSGR